MGATIIAAPVIVLLYDDAGNPLVVADGSAPTGTAGVMVSGFDGTASRRILVDTSGRPIVNVNGTVPVSVSSSALPTNAAQETGGNLASITTNLGTTSDANTANTVIGRLKQLVTQLAGGLPAALTGSGSLKTAIVEAIAAGTNIIGKVGIDSATTGGLALDATLTGGTQKAIARGGTKGTTTAADLTSNPIDANTQALHVDGSKVTQPSSNAVGSQVDGHSVALGTTTDANTANTVIGRLKQLVTQFAGGLPAALTGSGSLKTAIVEAIAAGTNEIGKVAQGTAAALTGYWPVRHTDGTNTLPTMDAAARAGFFKKTDGTNTEPSGDAVARSIFQQIADGTTGPVAVKAASATPAGTDKALVVSLSPNSASPTAGLQVEGRGADAATPVGNPVLAGGYDSSSGFTRRVAVDSQGRIITVPAGSNASVSGFSNGYVATSATALVAVLATAYAEQSSNAQRSIVSSSAGDTSAGTGARTILLTYLTSTFVLKTEVITLNGTSAVNTVGTDICYIESIVVLTAGSTSANIGTISLKTTTGGGGSTIGTIAATDNRTFWAHHYTPTGFTSYITSVSGSNNNGSNGSVFSLHAIDLSTANAIEGQISDYVHFGAATNTIVRPYGTPLKMTGPARLTLFVAPEGTPNITNRGAFDFYDQ